MLKENDETNFELESLLKKYPALEQKGANGSSATDNKKLMEDYFNLLNGKDRLPSQTPNSVDPSVTLNKINSIGSTGIQNGNHSTAYPQKIEPATPQPTFNGYTQIPVNQQMNLKDEYDKYQESMSQYKPANNRLDAGIGNLFASNIEFL